MSQLLDLSITLTPAPADSPPEVLASMALRCEALGTSHSGDLLKDPLTQPERADLQWYLEEYWKWPYEQFLERGKRVEVLLPELGKRLYKAVLRAFTLRDDQLEAARQAYAVADFARAAEHNPPPDCARNRFGD